MAEQFLAAVPPELREHFAGPVHRWPHGLYHLFLFVTGEQSRPFAKSSIPAALIQTLLDDPEALPLHDCSKCGLPIAIRPGQPIPGGMGKTTPAVVYFPTCPACGGETGRYAYPNPMMEAFRKLPIERQVKICTRDSEREYFYRAVAEGREP